RQAASVARHRTAPRCGSGTPSSNDHPCTATPRIAGRRERAVLAYLDRRYAAEEAVPLPPPDDGLAGHLELVRCRRVLAVDESRFDMDPRGGNRLCNLDPARDHLPHALEDGAGGPEPPR